MKNQWFSRVTGAYLKRVFIFVWLFLVGAMVGCTHQQAATDDADGLYREAETAFKDERYLFAIDRFRDIKNRFPYSSKAVEAELRIADSYFAQESFLEAESAYEIFKELHPAHPRIDYVWFQIALSYYNQIPSNTARDLSAAYKAIESFELVQSKFPNSTFATKAKELQQETRKKIAEQESNVADFYFRREHYLSASYRYSNLIKEFSDLGYGEEALFRLGQCYRDMRMVANARDAWNRLLKQFPMTDYKNETSSLIKQLETATP